MFLDPLRTEIASHFDWYEGRLDSLFNSVNPTSVNGLGIIGPENLTLTFNYFAALSKFFSSAVESDLPKLSSPREETLISNAAEHWSVAGECCLVGTPGDVSLVRPDYVHPVYNRYNRDMIDRILFIYPERDFATPTFDNQVIATDNALVIEYIVETGQAFQSIRKYSPGNIEDEPRGDEIDIGMVRYITTGPPVYRSVAPIVREICVRLNFLGLALNTTSMPIIQIDKEAINGGDLTARGVTTFADLKRAITGPLGINIPPAFSGEAEASYVEREGRGLDESMNAVRMLLSQMSIISSVPDYVFGINLSKPNSETERVLFAANSKVNAFRRQLDEALSEFGIDITFTDNPFATATERNKIVMDQLAAGIITIEEARTKLNIN